MLCLAGVLAVAGHAAAQSHPYAKLADTIFNSTSPDTGMPNGVVQSIAQDADGYIWLGTQGGLARWDGTHFRNYFASSEPGSLVGNSVMALHADQHGRLWVGTDNGGLARYDPSTDRFVPVRLGLTAGAQGILAIADDGKGGLWVGTNDGVFHVSRAAAALASGKLEPDRSSAFALAGSQVLSLAVGPDGTLWAGTTIGLFKIDTATGARQPVDLPTEDPSNKFNIYALMRDSAGQIWVGTTNAGAFIVSPDGQAITAAQSPKDKNGEPYIYAVCAFVEVSPGTIWVGTVGHGVMEFRQQNRFVRIIAHDPWVKTSLINDSIRSAFKDRTGRIWLGTDSGVSRYDPSQRAVATMFGFADRPHGLSGPDVVSVTSMPDGTVWAGLHFHGIDIIDPRANTVESLWPDSRHVDRALPPFAIAQMVAIPDGAVLAATASGLYRLTDKGHTIERMAFKGFPYTTDVLSLCYCHGSVWVGEGGGLWQLDVDPSGQVRVLRRETGNRLTDPRVQSIHEGPGDEIWVGTVNGLNVVHANSPDIERILPNRADKAQLGSGEIMTMVQDRQNRLWIGTLDDGLYLMSGEPGHRRFRHFGKAEGLPNDDISALVLDNAGNIWMSTDAGLASIDPERFTVRRYDADSGVAIQSYWNGSGTRDASGNLYFGGLGGLTIVDPALLNTPATHPALVISDVHVGSKPVWAGHPDKSGAIAPIVIHPGENSLRVEFTLLDFGTTAADSFSYRLEGFDADWMQNETTPRLATYTNLPPGQYVLKLRAARGNGLWLPQTLALPIIVLPSWYQTPWFRLAALVAGALFIAGLVQIRTAILRQRQHELERVVAERTAELSLTQAQLRHFAYVDMLTGLPNRRAFTEEFRRRLEDAQMGRSRLALLLIDMDGFKQVNDTLGHHAGDALLVAVGGRLRGAVRECDYVARLGGDEFAVLLLLQEEVVELVCERIIDGFAPPIAVEGENLIAGASIGVAIFPDHGLTQDRIYKMADIAMYAAKREGRGTWRCFAEKMETV